KISGDGAYDTYGIWELLKGEGIEGIIPPQENAIYWVDEFDNLLDLDRNKILEQIDIIGRKEWKIKSSYHRRSLAETAMMRFKTIFGSTLYSRIFEKQKTEAAIKIKCLNKMTAIGRPISKKIESKTVA
ncbi:MAG: transposase, partial [Saprospiraceae bacterium]|nr:transposase [Saprospiraceae bacterium]